MTPCPLCAQPDHPGKPCYAELRNEWKRQEAEKSIAEMLGGLPEWPEIQEMMIREGYEAR
jgi:hypothetical protein